MLLSAVSIALIVIGCILLSWYIQGKDILAILQSPLATTWYVLIGLSAFIGAYAAYMAKLRKKG